LKKRTKKIFGVSGVDIATLRALVDDGQVIRDIVLDAVDWQDLDVSLSGILCVRHH
jgi:hypothetical protein